MLTLPMLCFLMFLLDLFIGLVEILGHDIKAHLRTSFEGQNLVQRTLLGTGFVLGGSHPDLLAKPLPLTMEARLDF